MNRIKEEEIQLRENSVERDIEEAEQESLEDVNKEL